MEEVEDLINGNLDLSKREKKKNEKKLIKQLKIFKKRRTLISF